MPDFKNSVNAHMINNPNFNTSNSYREKHRKIIKIQITKKVFSFY